MTEQQLAEYCQRQNAAKARGNQLRTFGDGDELVHMEVPKADETEQRRRSPSYGEDAKQRSLVDWSQHVTVGAWKLSDLLFAVPNGGYRTPFEAVNFKLLGVQAGFPDLGLPVAAGRYHGGYWEMKHGKNKPSELQIAVHERLRECGYYVNTCWQWEEAAQDIVRYLAQSAYTVVERAKL